MSIQMKRVIAFSFYVIIANFLLYSKDYNFDKIYFGMVTTNKDSEYRIEKTLSHNLGEFVPELNIYNYVETNDSLRLYFKIKYGIYELRNFNIYTFSEDSSETISLIPIKICHDCNGKFDITIDKQLKELKLIIESLKYGMDYAIFKID